MCYTFNGDIMKKFLKVFILIGALVLITGCDSKYLKKISYSTYKEKLENKETFALEIMKKDCTHCKSLKPKLISVVEKYKIKMYYIDTATLSEEDYEKLYQETGIEGTPTIIFYHNGVEETKSSRVTGDCSKDKLISKFKVNGFIED